MINKKTSFKMRHNLESSVENPVQLDDFCRLCLLRKPNLHPLSSQIQTMMIPEMLYKVTGALLNMHDQLPRAICERCFVKLELAYNIVEEFRRQKELLRRLSWKGALVDQLIEYQHSEESRRKPHSEEVIERLTVVDNTVQLEELPKYEDQKTVEIQVTDDVEIKQETTPPEDQLEIGKTELFEATEYSMQVFPDDSIDEDPKQPEGKQEDSRKIGEQPGKLLEQLDMQKMPEDEPEGTSSGELIPFSSESEEEQSDDDDLPSLAESESGKEEGQCRCEICNERYDTKDEVDAHRLSEHKSNQKPWKFECKYCQQRFKGKNQKEKHEKSHQNPLTEDDPEAEQGPHKCPFCYRRYRSIGKYNAHIKRHENVKHGKFRCKLCFHRFGELRDLQKHEQQHEKNVEWRMARDNIPPPTLIEKDNETAYKCNFCKHISVNHFKYVQHAQRHIIHKAGMFQCGYCGNRYVTKKLLWHHQRKVHNVLSKPECDDKKTDLAKSLEIDKRLPKCSECDAYFLSQEDYKVHMRVHGSNQKTSNNDHTQEDGQQLEDATPKESPIVLPSTSKELCKSMALGSIWKCDECGKSVTIRSAKTYRNHKQMHETIRNVSEKCEVCKIAFSYNNTLLNHRLRSHGLVGPTRRRGRPRVSRGSGCTIECSFCKQKISKALIEKHTKTHENLHLRKYVCAKCDTPLGTHHHLKLHVESGVCEKPGYVPRTAEGLQEFFTWEGSQRAPADVQSPTMIDVKNTKFKCKQCGKLLKGCDNAARHASGHRLMKAGVYNCEICKQVFPAKLNLDRHIARNAALGTMCRKPENLSAR